ncbi:hypothetical protein EON81_12815 [bacterium]|nr:MAG: hypothetical protein EON81_12815 [bacterium]
MIAVALVLSLVGQQVERADDPSLIPTGRQHVMSVGSLWVKPEDRWIEFKNGYRRVQTTYAGMPASRKVFNLRIKATGFRKGSDRFALISVITYNQVSIQDSNWVIELPSYSQLIIAVKAPLGDLPAEGQAGTWMLPIVGSWTMTGTDFMPYWEAAHGNTFLAADQYVLKSFAAKLPGLLASGKRPQELAWPVFRVTPKAGPVVRYQLPVEAGIDIGQDWDSIYFETTPAAWGEFEKQLRVMVGQIAATVSSKEITVQRGGR